MLKARTCKARDPRFICASCRLRLSTPTPPPTATRAALHQHMARHLSTTALLHGAAGNASVPPPRAFPAPLEGRAGAAWGSLASRPNRSATVVLANDGLLPHERAARKQAAVVAKPDAEPEPLADAEPEPLARSSPTHPSRPAAGPVPDQPTPGATRARAVMPASRLAAVFNTNREPPSPPTPESWSTGYQQLPGSGPSAARTGWARTCSEPNGPAMGPFSNRKATLREPPPKPTGNSDACGFRWDSLRDSLSSRRPTLHEPTKPPGGGESQSPAWDSSSNRQIETVRPEDEPQVGDEEMTQSTRLEAAPPPGTGNPASGSQTVAAKPQADQAPRSRDFWGELENRVASFEPAQEPKGQGGIVVDRKSKKWKLPPKGRGVEKDDNWDVETAYRWEQRQRLKAEKKAYKQEALHKGPVPILLPEYISASNLAQALDLRPDCFLQDMDKMGFEHVTLDTIIAGDTAALVAMEYGLDPTVDNGSQRDLRPRPPPKDVSSLPGRPPVVTIMGHVDHGKTTLLDWLRKSSIAAQEHGGITQHIGAFVVNMSSGKSITFLDTPGHAAFLSMRQRGANVTDIVVLVVAADDSVKPQTIEALKHATAAKVPIIVAISKVDKADAQVDKVKRDLSRHGVEVEDYGGDVQVVCVSGKTGQGMEELEENIVTLSEVLDLRTEVDGMAEGWILESSVKQNGRAATVLVKRGTLRLGDLIVAGKTWARIRTLQNEAGIELAEAPPGTPVEILGWRELPVAGERVLQAPDEGRAKAAVDYRLEMANREKSSLQLAEQEQRQREKAALDAAKAEAAAAGEDVDSPPSEPAEPGISYQNFTVKADVVGSVEAVCGTILELGNHEVRPRILRSSAGQISEYDVDHAAASNSIIVNFNMPTLPQIKQRAGAANVKILDHSVIYHIVDDVKASLSELLPPAVSHRVNGEAEILQIFRINIRKREFRNIAGCRVRNGTIKRSSRVKVLRGVQVVFDGHIDTLRHVKKDVKEMGKGSECGIGLEDFDDFQVDDRIQAYEEMTEKRTL